MRVIDLLNKIAKGEEVPKKIKVGNIIWNYNEEKKTYFMSDTEIELFYVENITKKLNDEVGIIEDNLYIEELKIECMENQPSSKYIVNEYGTKCFLTKHSKIIADKVNEVIRNQKYILERLDK